MPYPKISCGTSMLKIYFRMKDLRNVNLDDDRIAKIVANVIRIRKVLQRVVKYIVGGYDTVLHIARTIDGNYELAEDIMTTIAEGMIMYVNNMTYSRVSRTSTARYTMYTMTVDSSDKILTIVGIAQPRKISILVTGNEEPRNIVVEKLNVGAILSMHPAILEKDESCIRIELERGNYTLAYVTSESMFGASVNPSDPVVMLGISIAYNMVDDRWKPFLEELLNLLVHTF